MQWMILQGKDGESIAKAAIVKDSRSPIAALWQWQPYPDSGCRDGFAGFYGPADLFEDTKGFHLISSSSSSTYLCLEHFI